LKQGHFAIKVSHNGLGMLFEAFGVAQHWAYED
jgi:hypothetical protein